MCAIHAATRPNLARKLTGSASKHVAHIVRSYKYIGDFDHA